MKRTVYATVIMLGVGIALLVLLEMMSGITRVVAPDAFAAPPDQIPRVEEGDYLPAGLQGLRMNMPLSEFLETEHGRHGVQEDSGFRQTVTTAYAGTEFSAVRFYFDSEGSQPLYEFIVEFPEGFDLSAYVEERYGEPTHQGEWRFRDQDDYYIMIWTVSFANRLIIAANIDGTEHQHRR